MSNEFSVARGGTLRRFVEPIRKVEFGPLPELFSMVVPVFILEGNWGKKAW